MPAMDVRPGNSQPSSIHMLFYGTLRELDSQHKGDSFYGFPKPQRVADLWVTGASLYDTGPYPGLVFDRSGGCINCTLYTLGHPQLLTLFDEIEACHLPDTRPLDREAGTGSLYLRQQLPLAPYRAELPASFNGDTAWIYTFNGTVQHAPTDYPLVPDGDWVAYRGANRLASRLLPR